MSSLRSIVIVAICSFSVPLQAADTRAEARMSPHGGEASSWYQGDWGRSRSWSGPNSTRSLVFAKDDDGISITHAGVFRNGDELIGSTMTVNIGDHHSTSSGGLATTCGQEPSLRIGSRALPRHSESFFESRGSFFEGTTWARDQ